jgi:drug/metabolite transporter (DMT)-like permease
MVVRGVGGIILVVLGAVWIAQGSGAMNGSAMSGHGQYAVLGVVVALIGLFLLVRAWRVRNRDVRQRP